MEQPVRRALTHRPRPATQCTATQQPGSSQNLVFNKLSQSSTILLGGGAPSSNGQSCKGGGQGQGKRETLSDPGEKLGGLLFTRGDGVWDLNSGEVDVCARNRARRAALRG